MLETSVDALLEVFAGALESTAFVTLEPGDAAAMKARLADHMLRYSLYRPNVDKLINAIRKCEWIAPNIGSIQRGPLTDAEVEWLRGVKAAREEAEAKK